MKAPSQQDTAFTRLRGFLRPDRVAAPRPEEDFDICELCSVPLQQRHRHLLERSSRRVVCSCDPCALRFHDVAEGRYLLIPRDAHALPDFTMTDAQWAALGVPIDLTFVFRDSKEEKRVALYPSPAGVTESLLPLSTWDDLERANPVLENVQDDVEALLINRLGDDPMFFIAPIDKCYELAGLIRVHWRGFSGGDEVWDEVDQFFERMTRYARHA